ncbi:DUF2165 domain-containing protein [Paenibacillus sp. GSMTC-2017]|uniref:DUF2165 family protein n=1 Tax=Paenibacillus sp. GSMTC-2017 TaxID=2794350 RepID=UPI0018D6126C|nr:DUF2165 domain-containing protein [Paenibacillus sp. GSMTC-2017]MBH5318361.1 DUF2165 domain-containing protein [Paenibacillus sp. GSMTC-2017]
MNNSIIRYLKGSFVLFFAIYVSLVVLGNVTDYNTNFLFVQHVLSMDTTFEGNTLMYRAITSPFAHHFAYILIIIVEFAVALTAWIGGIQLIKHAKAGAANYQKSKNIVYISLGLAIAIWFFGFMAIGGEWFAMWMSSDWNGLASANRIVTYVLGILIFLSLKNDE